MEFNFKIKTSDHRCTPMQLFKGRIALSSVCLSKCDKISRLPISCVNHTFINQVSYIHIKLSDVYVKRYTYTSRFFEDSYQVPRYSCQNIFPYQCIFFEPTFSYLEKKNHVKYKKAWCLVLSISKRKREHEN